ncbi:MAG: hypothetical protein EPN14_10560 [Gallionella sp.]|nr:MAG: hypothetical protein EPN14_10560 [Gallionella sp.]
MITTDLTFGERARVSGDANPKNFWPGIRMTTASPDRLTHHRHIVGTGSEPYRFRHSSATAKTRAKARERSKRGKTIVEGGPFRQNRTGDMQH